MNIMPKLSFEVCFYRVTKIIVHLVILIDTADAVDSIVDAVEHGVAKRMLTSGDVEHIAADRDDQQHENHQGQNDLQHCKIPPLCLRTFPGWPGRTPDSTPAQ